MGAYFWSTRICIGNMEVGWVSTLFFIWNNSWKDHIYLTNKHIYSLNERLSFLRYGPGHYFRGHCDGQLELPDGRKSHITIQIYLGDEEVEGGTTRIYADRRGKENDFVDIEPKKGRVLIFQQRGIFHSGEEVTKGVKYALRSDFMFRHTQDAEEVWLLLCWNLEYL